MRAKMKRIQSVILIFFIIAAARPAFSQQVKAEAWLDTTDILVGDQVGFHLGLTIPENYHFRWPVLNDTLTGHVEIVKKSTPDTLIAENGMMNIVQQLTLTAFDSGYYVIPPIKFGFTPKGDTLLQEIETEPYLLNVFTVAVDTTKGIKPIKGPMDAPYTFAEVLPWILLALAVFLIAGFVIYYFIKREQKVPLFSPRPRPKLPPHRVALDALEQLKNEKIWQKGRDKEYHTRLTDIIRVYLEDRFGVAAVEMTTPEILDSANKNADIGKDNINLLADILELADLVKFAKYKPQPSENEKVMVQAFEFVQNTLPAEARPEKQNQENRVETKQTEIENQAIKEDNV